MAEGLRAGAVLVAVEFPHAYLAQRSGTDGPLVSPEESLAELGRLAVTAGYRPVERTIQRRDAPDAAFFVGSGKAAALGELARSTGATHVIFDDDLKPVQARNLEDATGLVVLDRTQLILHIFAGRARTREGRLQADLARLLYELPRLSGHGAEMSRLGASAGAFTRGPGESQLEAQRRTIRSRVSDLRREIEGLRRHRSLHREGRRRVPLPVISLVGYTNAGKSTLLNALTGAGVLAEDKLFATLDPTTRGLSLPGGVRALLTDTVGFIRKLPHAVVAAFRATLEEVAESDLLLHVVDASAPAAAAQAATVRQVLAEVGAVDTPAVVALNKSDQLEAPELVRLTREFPGAVVVSALAGTGLDDLRSALGYALRDWQEEIDLLVPYDRSELVALAHQQGEVIHQSYEPAGVVLRARLRRGLAAQLKRAAGDPPGSTP